MNVIGWLFFALGFVSFVSLIDAIDDWDEQARNDRRSYDSMPIGDSTMMKRPFCNAFTGCGKKRSISHRGNNLVEEDEGSVDKIAVPLPIYRALLRAANRQIDRGLFRRSAIGEYSPSDLNDPPSPSFQRYQS